MMPHFVKPSFDGWKYKTDWNIENRPVNVGLCKALVKRTVSLSGYDNRRYPAIFFDGCDVTWTYQSEEARDADFERIASNQFQYEGETHVTA